MAEEFVDEIICEDNTTKKEITRVDKIISILEETLQTEDFIQSQDDFIDKNCDLFDEEGDLPPQCMSIYKQFAQLIEDKLLSSVQKVFPDFQFEELTPCVTAKKGLDSFVHAEIFDLLNAILDFNEFRSFMASYKRGKDVDLEVLKV